ncbi:MAG TPA: DUF5681 domain-containing protein [Rhizomicrobium sp.]|nr:DUF5681 domain-containing protein [Rhizomicrobium sp.]
MNESPYEVGYRKPPEHTRFQKGQSGNPGGKPKRKAPAQQAFDAAVAAVLNADKQALKDARPVKLIEAFVRRVALDAADGRPSAQRLLLSLIERDGPAPAEPAHVQPVDEARAEERARAELGERYDEFNARFRAAVKAESVEDLRALAEEFRNTEKFPQSGNF